MACAMPWIRACAMRLSSSLEDLAVDSPLLHVEDLRTHFFTSAGVIKAVDGVNFTVPRGQILGWWGNRGVAKVPRPYR